MKDQVTTIEERANKYADQNWSGDGWWSNKDAITDAYIDGAEVEHAELTRWNDDNTGHRMARDIPIKIENMKTGVEVIAEKRARNLVFDIFCVRCPKRSFINCEWIVGNKTGMPKCSISEWSELVRAAYTEIVAEIDRLNNVKQ